ncbi:MAG: hypothetical protein Kow00104_05270 [Rhodothalassiaceae bacterium]
MAASKTVPTGASADDLLAAITPGSRRGDCLCLPSLGPVDPAILESFIADAWAETGRRCPD